MNLVILGIFICLFASAFFSLSEFAVISANKLRLEHAYKEGDLRALKILDLLKEMDSIIAAILIGNNIANGTLSALMTLLIAQIFSDSNYVPLITTIIATPILLIISEIIPKNFGGYYADSLIFYLYKPLKFFIFIFKPFLYLINKLIKFLAKSNNEDQDLNTPLISKEEFVYWVKKSVQDGAIKEDTEKMIKTTFDFQETIAREVMMPLLDVKLVNANISINAFIDFARKHKYTRYPVYEDRVDQMIGFVNIYEAFRQKDKEQSIKAIIHEISFVPNFIAIDKLLFQMQASRQKMVAIVNEYGGCDGICTIEDIIEELVGEIAEDHEKFEPQIKELANNCYLIDASIDIDDLNYELETNFEKDGFDTLAGLVLKVLAKIPKEGDITRLNGYIFEIKSVERLAIRQVLLSFAQEDLKN